MVLGTDYGVKFHKKLPNAFVKMAAVLTSENCLRSHQKLRKEYFLL